jgi:hypothetical protein
MMCLLVSVVWSLAKALHGKRMASHAEDICDRSLFERLKACFPFGLFGTIRENR